RGSFRISICKRTAGIGVDRMIEDVKEFGAELGREAFLEFPVLEDGEIPIGKMRAVEEVPSHRAELTGSRRNHKRAGSGAGDVAASVEKPASGVVWVSRIKRPDCCSLLYAFLWQAGINHLCAVSKCDVTWIKGRRVEGGVKVAGSAVEVPTVLKLVCTAEICAIGWGPRLSGLEDDGRTQDPTFEQLARGLLSRNVIGGREAEVMANIKLRSAVVAHGIQAVLRVNHMEVSTRQVVQGVAIGVPGNEGEIVEVACRQSSLEALVIGDGRIGHLIDVLQIGKLRIEGQIGDRFAVAAGKFRGRIGVD